MSEEKSSKIILNPGDDWPEHYRGSKYHFDSDGKVWWRLAHMAERIYCDSGHENIVQELLKVKSTGGSFRITGSGDVITKIEEKKEVWKPVYVCEMDEPLDFPEVENIADSLNPGDLWRGFYDGAKYSFVERKIWWKNPETGTRQYTHETLPLQVLKEITFLKPTGGSFRITENGHVITLINPQPLPANLKEQYESMTNTQKRIIETIVVRGAKMLPVYIGDYHGGFTLKPIQRLTDPLADDELRRVVSFLNQYGPPDEAEEDNLPDFEDDIEEEEPENDD